MKTTEFEKDKWGKGKPLERKFKLYMERKQMSYKDVSEIKEYQDKDIDFIVINKKGIKKTIDIKATYKDDGKIVIETKNNCNPEYGNISAGWIYKNQSDIIVFASDKVMIVFYIKDLRERFEKIQHNYKEIKNRMATVKDGAIWHSAYKRLPLCAFQGLYKELRYDK